MIGGATAGLGAVVGTMSKASKAARVAYNESNAATQLGKGTAAHSAWTAVMKKTIPGTYNKAIGAGSQSRMDYRLGKMIGIELKPKAQVSTARTIKQVAKYRKAIKIVLRAKY